MNASSHASRGIVLALALALVGPAGAALAGKVESLRADSALAEVRAMEGVVLVDLYADW